LRFVALWIAAYLVLSRTSFASERIARELSVPFAVGAAGLALWAMRFLLRRYDRKDGQKMAVWAAATLAAVVSLTAANGIVSLATNSDPVTLEYIEPYQLAAYHWLEAHSNRSEAVLVLASADPFLSVFVPNDVFPIVNIQQAQRLSVPDRDLDIALVSALMNYTNASSRTVFAAHGIRWIVLSTPFFPPRWLAPDEVPFVRQAWNLTLDSDPAYRLPHSEVTPSGATRIFQIVAVGGT